MTGSAVYSNKSLQSVSSAGSLPESEERAGALEVWSSGGVEEWSTGAAACPLLIFSNLFSVKTRAP